MSGFLLLTLAAVGPLAAGEGRPTDLHRGADLLAMDAGPDRPSDVEELAPLDLSGLTPARLERLDGQRLRLRVITDSSVRRVGDRDVFEAMMKDGGEDLATVWMYQNPDIEDGMIVEGVAAAPCGIPRSRSGRRRCGRSRRIGCWMRCGGDWAGRLGWRRETAGAASLRSGPLAERPATVIPQPKGTVPSDRRPAGRSDTQCSCPPATPVRLRTRRPPSCCSNKTTYPQVGPGPAGTLRKAAGHGLRRRTPPPTPAQDGGQHEPGHEKFLS